MLKIVIWRGKSSVFRVTATQIATIQSTFTSPNYKFYYNHPLNDLHRCPGFDDVGLISSLRRANTL